MLHVAIAEDEDACARQLEEYLQRFQEESGTQMSITRFAAHRGPAGGVGLPRRGHH